MTTTTWIADNLWNSGYFAPERLGEPRVLFEKPCKWPLLVNLIDGSPTMTPWPLAPGVTSLTQSLFLRIRTVVSRYPADWVYITDPDNALSVVCWERDALRDDFDDSILEVFEREPAEEGGASHLVLLFRDRAGAIVFELENDFRIVYYGNAERWKHMDEALRNPIPDPAEARLARRLADRRRRRSRP